METSSKLTIESILEAFGNMKIVREVYKPDKVRAFAMSPETLSEFLEAKNIIAEPAQLNKELIFRYEGMPVLEILGLEKGKIFPLAKDEYGNYVFIKKADEGSSDTDASVLPDEYPS